MKYDKQNFIHGQVLHASHLNHIEDGLEDVTEEITDLQNDVSDLNDRTADANTKINAVWDACAFPRTETDSIIRTSDALAMEAVSVVSEIDVIQDGDGEPNHTDNIRPISGWDSVNVVRAGKNLLPETTMSFVARHDVHFDPPLPPGTYTISAIVTSDDTETTVSAVYFYNNTKSLTKANLNRGVRETRTITVEKEITTVCFFSSQLSSSSKNDACVWSDVQMEQGSVATAYEPYQGVKLTSNLPETVYGGTLDWTTGLLTVNHARYVVTGDEGWAISEFYEKRFDVNVTTEHNSPSPTSSVNLNVVCSHHKTAPYANVNGAWVVRTNDSQLGLRWCDENSEFASVDAFVSYLKAQYDAGTPVTYVYECEPYTMQLTPQQLSMLRGINTVYSGSGDTTLIYNTSILTVVAEQQNIIRDLSERLSALENA